MRKENTKKAIIYCRVSSKEQVDEGNSLVTQERHCKEYAYKNDYVFSEIFIEEGESAKTTDRTQLLGLMEFCRKNHKDIDLLIVYSLDRLARNTNDYTTLRAFFSTYEINLVSVTEKIEDSPSGRFLEHVLAAKSQLDNEERALKCKGGMVEAVREGRFVWGAPVGFVNVKGKGTANIKPDEKKAKYIRRIL